MIAGFVNLISALKIGKISFRLGSGRKIPSDKVDHSVGCKILVSKGDNVSEEQTWAILYHNKPLCDDIRTEMETALTISPEPVTYSSVIVETLEN